MLADVRVTKKLTNVLVNRHGLSIVVDFFNGIYKVEIDQ